MTLDNMKDEIVRLTNIHTKAIDRIHDRVCLLIEHDPKMVENQMPEVMAEHLKLDRREGYTIIHPSHGWVGLVSTGEHRYRIWVKSRKGNTRLMVTSNRKSEIFNHLADVVQTRKEFKNALSRAASQHVAKHLKNLIEDL